MALVGATRLGLYSFCLVALVHGRPAHAGELTYTKDIKPLLDAHCVECHHDGGRHPDLSAFPFRAEGVEGSGDASEQVVQKILEKVDTAAPKMPPGVRKKLTRDEVARIRTWLEQGLNP